LKSQKLLESVLHYEGFSDPAGGVANLLQDEFDLEGLKKVLTELNSGPFLDGSAYGAPQPICPER